MRKVRLIVMSFDGEKQREGDTFNDVGEAWEHAGDMGSRWYFYPFRFVVTESGQTIVDTPSPLEHLKGRRVKTVQRLFKMASEKEENQGLDVEEFAFQI